MDKSNNNKNTSTVVILDQSIHSFLHSAAAAGGMMKGNFRSWEGISLFFVFFLFFFSLPLKFSESSSEKDDGGKRKTEKETQQWNGKKWFSALHSFPSVAPLPPPPVSVGLSDHYSGKDSKMNRFLTSWLHGRMTIIIIIINEIILLLRLRFHDPSILDCGRNISVSVSRKDEIILCNCFSVHRW